MKLTHVSALAISLAAAAAVSLTACSKSSEHAEPSDQAVATADQAEPAPTKAPEAAEDELKVAFIYVGPIGDAGWTFSHDLARKDLEAQFPWVKTTYRESVPEGAGAERAITQFAEKGYKVIFTTSFGFMDPTIEVAKRYPDTVFMHCSGYKRADNVGTYFGRMYQAKYLAGLVAGSMTKSGTIGFVAPHPIPEVIRHINAFTIGVREVKPDATVKVVWTNEWFDPGKEKEAADALLDAGADVIATGADSAAPLQAAEARGALAIGYDSDSREFAPSAFLTAPLWDWRVVYRDVVQQVKNGTWKAGDFWGGLETGVIHLAPLADKIPAEVKALVEARTKELSSGSRKVFAGPLTKQDGSEAQAAGGALADPDLLSMRWFVAGVEGTIPE
ncbi:BMP family ABC transporter substrate-binding protein [Haliangium sp.]|uniref:BMP family ABC transporter substrate-binding protein n=1 Tax=Haliangium sp. TaxID=2663208 RepID=UPI003D0B26C2